MPTERRSHPAWWGGRTHVLFTVIVFVVLASLDNAAIGAIPAMVKPLTSAFDVSESAITILTGAHPYRIYEVAPYITLVGIGAQFTGALSVNLDVWNDLPADAQRVLSDLGKEYTELTSAEAMRRYAIALEAMQVAGATVPTLAPAEKQRWIDGLPPLAELWVERNEQKGLPAREVLLSLMAGLRAAGSPPVKNWDETLVD